MCVCVCTCTHYHRSGNFSVVNFSGVFFRVLKFLWSGRTAEIFLTDKFYDSPRSHAGSVTLRQGVVTPIGAILTAATGVTMWSRGHGRFFTTVTGSPGVSLQSLGHRSRSLRHNNCNRNYSELCNVLGQAFVCRSRACLYAFAAVALRCSRL